ncbi:type IV toxin-antitoxin system AbiEi family antitoxin domain-containing protein [Candidatus Uhrbacteria bacterium]|nr:type IV toxin-antitoxin system AbiEi family antitoxin domain-containing protein [Candidatus Uhrbacteria bacterium]
MTLLSLMDRARSWPIFSVQDCAKWFPSDRRSAILLGLNRYVASGHIFRLRRGLYLLNQKPYPDTFSMCSRLDPLAVMSTESVLHHTGMIPEIPFATTAVTPAITARYQPQEGGLFIFRHVKPELLFGFEIEKRFPYSVRIARPEKALLDLLWFHRFEHDPDSYLAELRLEIPDHFSWKRFKEYAHLFGPLLAPLSDSVIRYFHT